MYQDLIRSELNEAAQTLNNFLADEANILAIQQAAQLLAASFKADGKVLSCGNGGSHCDAMHFAEELTGRYRENRPGYPAIAISDPSHLSCVSNDFGYDYVFRATLRLLGVKGTYCWGSRPPATPATSSGPSGCACQRDEGYHTDRERWRQDGRKRRRGDPGAAFRLRRSYSGDPHQGDPYHDPADRKRDGVSLMTTGQAASAPR